MTQPDELKKPEPLTWSHGTGVEVWEAICAAMSGDLGATKRLVERDPGLVRSHYEYRTPLYFAVRENRLEVARFLLDRGANQLGLAVGDSHVVTARDRGYVDMERLLVANLASAHGIAAGGEEIAAAIRAGDLASLRAMLDVSPELVHAAESHGNRPIHMAVMMRRLAVLDELLARGAEIESQRGDGARPIQLANGDYFFRGWRDAPKDIATTPRQVIDRLRQRGAACDIATASHIGDLERVRELLDCDPTLANRPSDYITYYACSGSPLRNAAGAGHLEIVRLLLERGADPNLPEEHIAPHGFALHAAVCNGHIEIVRLLLERGARPNVEVESSADTLSAVIRRSDQPLIDLLCSFGAARRVHLLAYYGDVQTAAAVFSANPALADDPEALCNAAGEGHEAFVRLMLRYWPELPRRVSCAGKSSKLTEVLFEHGMDANRANWLGIAPLHQFARKGDLKNAAIFLRHGADVNVRDEDIRSTPLAWAAKHGQLAMVEFLLRRGARLTLPDDPPWATPIAWARRRGHDRIVELLESHEQGGLLPAPSIDPLERLVSDLMDAYGAGDPGALRRVRAAYQFNSELTREMLREIVSERLGEPAGESLSPVNAQLLVARSRQFDSWEEMVSLTLGDA